MLYIKYGRGTIKLACGLGKKPADNEAAPWELRRDYLSTCYTTNIIKQGYSLQADNTLYLAVEKATPHHKKYRVGKVYPKDSYHIACSSHKTRIQNILHFPGIDQLEKSLLKQRIANLSTAHNGYIEKQKKALAN